jgi:hypothetical protein
MTKVEEIEDAVSRLPVEDLAKFRLWFETFDAIQFDRKIEHDAVTGRLDRLADAASADFKAGRAREI